jgi:hypothetical protein
MLHGRRFHQCATVFFHKKAKQYGRRRFNQREVKGLLAVLKMKQRKSTQPATK